MTYLIAMEGGSPGRTSMRMVALDTLVSFLMITKNSYVSFSCMLTVSKVKAPEDQSTGPGPSLKQPPLSGKLPIFAAVLGVEGLSVDRLPLG